MCRNVVITKVLTFEKTPLEWPALHMSYTKIFNFKVILRWKMNKARLPPTDYRDKVHAILNDYKQEIRHY